MKETGEYLNRESSEDFLLTGSDSGAKGSAVKLWAAACAFLLTAILLGGFFFLRARNVQSLKARQEAAEAAREIPLPPQAQVFHDEVVLRGSKAVVGGSVRNIADVPLDELYVEIELMGRAGQTNETRPVRVEPASLRPGEEGRFTLQIVSSDWTGTRVARLYSADSKAEIPFKPEQGAKRPTERPPAPKVIVVPRPKPKGDDFLNTPDTPIRIP